MTVKKNEAGNLLPMTVTDDLTVTILPSSEYEFLMPTKEVARGYGVKESTLRDHAYRNKSELKEGLHFVRAINIYKELQEGVGNTDTLPKGLQPHSVYYTKQGIVRLGFFIKSERAKLFRDWVEQLVINCIERKLPTLPETPKRKHNRLTPERLLDIMADICQIEDKGLRMSITNKLLEQPQN